VKEFPSYLSRTVTGLPRLMQTKGPIRLRLYGNRPTAIGLSPQRAQVGLKNLIISIKNITTFPFPVFRLMLRCVFWSGLCSDMHAVIDDLAQYYWRWHCWIETNRIRPGRAMGQLCNTV